MKHIIITALLLTLVLASLRGSDKKQNHPDREERWGGRRERKGHDQRRHEESSVSQSYSGSESSESNSYSYSGASNYSEDSDEYSGPSNYSESEYSGSQEYSGYDDSEYSGSSGYSDDNESSNYSSQSDYSDSDEYSGSGEYDSEYSGSGEYDSESSGSESVEERQRGPRHQIGSKGFGKWQGQKKDWKQHQKGDWKQNKQNHGPHPPQPQDEFPRVVFKTLRKTGKVILEEWNVVEDPVLKNQIRDVLVQNLEDLLPVAETPVDPVDPVDPVVQVQVEKPQPPQPDERHPHPHPPPPPPQPEDGFAQQVFQTLHQIGFDILEKWNVEQDVDAKNQIRADLIQRLSDLVPVQPVADPTVILDKPIEVTIIPNARITEEEGN